LFPFFIIMYSRGKLKLVDERKNNTACAKNYFDLLSSDTGTIFQ
jgi:hypothetical protein